MNIAIIISDITLSAGTERAVVNLANNLIKEEYINVSIISCSRKFNECKYNLDKDVKVHYMDFKPIGEITKIERIFWYRRVKDEIEKYIKKNSIDIILGTMHNFNSLLPFIKYKKCKKIGCEHLCYQYSAGKISSFIRRIMYKKLDYIITLTEEDAKIYKKINKKTVCIPNNISFYPRIGADLEQKVVLSVGRLTYQKGFDMLIDAFDIVVKKHSDWKLRIVGEGELREELQLKIYNKNLTDFIELVRTTNKIEEEYKNASIYAMSSRFEGFPMVLLEAKSYGLPCVSLNCPTGPKEIIFDDEDGIIIDNNDIQFFADSICKLIENEELRKCYGKKSRENILEYSAENIRKKWLDMLDDLYN